MVKKIPNDAKNDKSLLVYSLIKLKDIINKKSGKLEKNQIEILDKYFADIRGWSKRGKDKINKEYNLKMIKSSDNETKDILFSFMAIVVDSGSGGLNGVWNTLNSKLKKQ